MKTNPPTKCQIIGFTFSFCILLAAAAFYVLTAAKIENPGSDTSIYLELAKNILYEQKYWFNFEPHIIYPPGFPALLAAFIYLFGDNYPLLVKMTAAAGFVGVFGTFLLFTHKNNWTYALLICALTLFSPFFYFWITSGLSSDGLYFAVTVLIFLCLELYLRSEKAVSKSMFWFLTVALSGYIVWVRSIGVAVLAGFICWIAIPLFKTAGDKPANYRKRLAVALPSILLAFSMLGGWTVWAKQNKSVDLSNYYMGSYFSQLIKKDPQIIDSGNIAVQDVPGRIISMTGIRGANLIKKITGANYIKPSVLHFPVFIIVLCIMTGMTYSLIHSNGMVDWYLLCYLGIIIMWPFNEEGRFLFPIFPFLINYLIKGVIQIRLFISEKLTGKMSALLLCVMIAMLALNIVSVKTSGRAGIQDFASIALWSVTILLLSAGNKIKRMAVRLLNDQKAKDLVRFGAFSALGVVLAGVIANGSYKIAALSAHNLSEAKDKCLQLEWIAAAEWIKKNTDKNHIVMGEQYAILHRMTQRKTYRFPLTTSIEGIHEAIKILNVDFIVIVNKKPFDYYMPCAEDRFHQINKKYSKAFLMVEDFGLGKIYRVDKDNLEQLLEEKASSTIFTQYLFFA